MSSIAIVFTAWPNHPQRWNYFLSCVPRAMAHLSAKRHELKYFCVSENEKDPNSTWLGDSLSEFCQVMNVPLFWRTGSASLGGMMNIATELGSNHCDYTMIIQDDWYITEPCDLSYGIEMMDLYPEIDIIRYSWPEHLGVTIMPQTFCGQRRLDPKGLWPYGDDPHIRRRAFIERFGKYKEGPPHGMSEGDMVYRFGEKNAFILLADKCYFGHCGPVSAAFRDADPGRLNSRKV